MYGVAENTLQAVNLVRIKYNANPIRSSFPHISPLYLKHGRDSVCIMFHVPYLSKLQKYHLTFVLSFKWLRNGAYVAVQMEFHMGD